MANPFISCPHPKHGTPTLFWEYKDEAGKTLFYVARFDQPDGSKQILPLTPDGKGGWQWKGHPEPRPLYGLDRFAANPTANVLVCEGEKAADAAQNLLPDYVCTTSPNGANSAHKADWSPLAGRNVILWPDNDTEGQNYAQDVAKLATKAAASVSIVSIPATTFPNKWDVADPLPEGITQATIRQMIEQATWWEESRDDEEEAPPLIRPTDPATEFPIDALGEMLGNAARAIQDMSQAPLALCGQSVLAAATLVAQGLADVIPPRGSGKPQPLSNFFSGLAATGERKSTADSIALTPIREKEKALRQEHKEKLQAYNRQQTAYEAAKKKAITGEGGRGKKMEMASIEANLHALGDPPEPPLSPFLTCTDPTVEGLAKALINSHPSLGLFSDEGGTFTAGYGMSKENIIKTAGALSKIWDGAPIDRVRALDGTSVTVGRRVSLHIMFQPKVAHDFLGNDQLADQGLLSRILLAAPPSTTGTRFEEGRTLKAETRPALERYNQTLAALLVLPLPLAEGTRNELDPPALTFTPEAETLWVRYHDHIEAQAGHGGELDPIRGLANKAATHVARLAGVLTIIDNPKATQINENAVQRGCALMDYYLAEALRLFGQASIDALLATANEVREWLLHKWTDNVISATDLAQYGINRVRDTYKAREILSILEDNGNLTKCPRPVTIRDKKRREAWQIVGHPAGKGV